jgi:hypothetical protein
VAAAGVAAEAALEVIGHGEHQVGTFEVVVSEFERGWLRFEGRIAIHLSIFA